jgi:hypothetical protein
VDIKKLLKRQKFAPVNVVSGDRVQLTYRDFEVVDGKAVPRETVLVDVPITETHIFDEGLIFEDEFEGRYALVGAFVEQEGKKR